MPITRVSLSNAHVKCVCCSRSQPHAFGWRFIMCLLFSVPASRIWLTLLRHLRWSGARETNLQGPRSVRSFSWAPEVAWSLHRNEMLQVNIWRNPKRFFGLPERGKFATEPVRCSFLIMWVMPERLTTKPSPFKVFNIPAEWRSWLWRSSIRVLT